MTPLEYIVTFSLFVVMQSFLINGLHYCFKYEVEKLENGEFKFVGNILFPISLWISKRKGKFWIFIRKPMYECIRCMSSIHSSYTFFPFTIWLIGFHWWIFLLWIADILILVTLNWYIYKRL